jgi:hypothetical protein
MKKMYKETFFYLISWLSIITTAWDVWWLKIIYFKSSFKNLLLKFSFCFLHIHIIELSCISITDGWFFKKRSYIFVWAKK